ncbi:hypothetical protein QUF64_00475 [Anaerolineales bacterium HSG6]|nr:hypothetical protein [Anaerolineales bacterium HSG6]MDM8529947.1 hypothetical protein [Anaerolineales bacterium HSG25]
MIDYVTIFNLENQFVLHEDELECSAAQAKRIVTLLANDLWPVSYGQATQRIYLHEADRQRFAEALQWAKSVVWAEVAGKMDDYETLYGLMAERVARHACLRYYRVFMSENDFCHDDIAHLRWVVTSPLVELVVWLSAAKGLWTREWE